MKLLKLVYIAHGWHLGLWGSPLISNRVEAWKYGPVIPDLYHEIKGYRDAPVLGIDDRYRADINVEDKGFVESIFKIYEDETGFSLSNLTHAVGTPWDKVYNPDSVGTIIPNKVIEEHYKALSGN